MSAITQCISAADDTARHDGRDHNAHFDRQMVIALRFLLLFLGILLGRKMERHEADAPVAHGVLPVFVLQQQGAPDRPPDQLGGDRQRLQVARQGHAQAHARRDARADPEEPEDEVHGDGHVVVRTVRQHQTVGETAVIELAQAPIYADVPEESIHGRKKDEAELHFPKIVGNFFLLCVPRVHRMQTTEDGHHLAERPIEGEAQMGPLFTRVVVHPQGLRQPDPERDQLDEGNGDPLEPETPVPEQLVVEIVVHEVPRHEKDHAPRGVLEDDAERREHVRHENGEEGGRREGMAEDPEDGPPDGAAYFPGEQDPPDGVHKNKTDQRSRG
mmetsp:Transcript_15468/g.30823  ORF Transcript_15468/g.30823 Transcript_15468/m.30823 type:complete len:329 (-) Transcript_15468:1985-2971(-)